ncbi:MAG TPA: exodeoxyribonuclease V subunit alpha [Noviherbaspirillum sp.]|nr:exodeoxyribonuclease V subunit alpha [Noviherbaspirillum sp.]
MTTAFALYEIIDQLADDGALRRMATAFARFIGALDPERTPVPLLLGAALLAEFEGRGHSCLDLSELREELGDALALPTERWQQVLAAAGPLPTSADAWRTLLLACPQVRAADEPDRQQPLVLDGIKLYLRRYWCAESLIAQSVIARASHRREVDGAAVRQWLDRLFEPDPQESGPDWQKIACAVAVRSQLTIVTGGPGTGKTYTVARLLALLLALADDPAALRIALAAPTGKAATRLKQSIDQALADLAKRVGAALPLAELASRMSAGLTLHTLLGARPDTRKPRHHAGNPLDLDVLVVDEASMVDLEKMALLLDALPAHAMVILLGDKDQLASVEAGAVLGDLCHRAQEGRYAAMTAAYLHAASGETMPDAMLGDGNALAQQTVMLRKSRRFGGPIGTLALAVNRGDVNAARETLRAPDEQVLAWIERARRDDVLSLAMRESADATGGFGRYLALLKARPDGKDGQAYNDWVKAVLGAFDTFRILCAVRDTDWGVKELNAALENTMDAAGALRCRGEWYPGRPVMVTRNDRSLGVVNGDVGITLPDPARPQIMRVYFDAGDTVRSVLPSRLPHVETAFAMTVHKAQGSEFLHAALVLPSASSLVLTRELVYTGITRAKARFTLLTPDASVLDDAVRKQTQRASGLQERIGRHDVN